MARKKAAKKTSKRAAAQKRSAAARKGARTRARNRARAARAQNARNQIAALTRSTPAPRTRAPRQRRLTAAQQDAGIRRGLGVSRRQFNRAANRLGVAQTARGGRVAAQIVRSIRSAQLASG
ncbi:MAG: hypothetical protein E6Q97_09885 [Desulfurellales bacterium]|jgi:hypothetical protein|nr:MAG: hypothetical protein E6Q97_09885 [Desulfurellales bacterium]